MSNNRRNSHAQIRKRFEAEVKKAEAGDTSSMRVIADFYASGYYLPKDYFAAEAWLRKAAELDDDEAKRELAELLTKGNGIAKNLEEAFDLYHLLMLDCDIDAMAEVGLRYKEGIGVPKDEAKASFYIKHAFNIAMDLGEEED